MALRLADLPAPETIRAGGEALVVRRLGAGPRVVLLHGGPGLDHHLLLPLALPLAARHEIWLPDLPGHGSAAGTAPGLLLLLERLGRFLAAIDPEVIGGHSLGAWLARELMHAKVVRPRAAVWICPPGPVRGKDARRAVPPPVADTEAAQREALLDQLGVVSPLMREAVDSAAIRTPSQHARLSAALQPLLRAAVRPFDPRCPVLVLGAAADRTAPPAAVQAVAAATRGATLVMLAGAGHFPWAADAGPCATAIDRFLGERLG